MIETYSASSLRLLQKSKSEYIKKYKMSLFLRHTTENEKIGNMFHKLIFYYLKGFDVSKMVETLDEKNNTVWKNLLQSEVLKHEFLFVEQPFLIKQKGEVEFFLNGRFDAVLKEGDFYIIYDWKSENIPRDPEDDIQTIVYMHSASKLFNTTNIKLRYVSIKKLETTDIVFDDSKDYGEIITNIVSK